MPKGAQARRKGRLGEVAGIIFIAAGIFLGICIFVHTDTGVLGGAAKDVMLGLFGFFAYLSPFFSVFIGVVIIAARSERISRAKAWLAVLLIISAMSLAQTFMLGDSLKTDGGFFGYVADSYSFGVKGAGSGAVGCLFVYPLSLLIGKTGCIVLFITAIAISVIVIANLSIKSVGGSVAEAGRKAVMKARESAEERKKRRLYIEDLRENRAPASSDGPEIPGSESFKKSRQNSFFDDEIYTSPEPAKTRQKKPPAEKNGAEDTYEPMGDEFNDLKPKKAPESAPAHGMRSSGGEYSLPPVSLLSKPVEKNRNSGLDEQRKNAQLIEETLSNFGVEAKVVHIVKGPVVTRYEIKPAPGVRVRRIKELDNDLAMALAARSVKIEAPIPGKAAVGIEVPNSDVTFVHLRSLIETEEFRKAKSPLTFALGKDIAGKNYFVDITEMPHLLIAGETGSGKSVCINSLLTSLLFKATPEELKMILIDPKVVELSGFKNIPHLLVPVVTDPKKAASALNWAVSEMTSRYKLFAEHGARDIARFNKLSAESKENGIPRIVIIIDELAELMAAAPHEVENSICRIAQLGRAAGIHLVVATQRPSVNVITGLIKANISSRIAFKVNSGIDSRTILDQNGAEKLLRNGDMLYHPSDAAKPIRLQGCYVSDSDIETVTEYVSGGSEAEFDEEVVSGVVSGGGEEEADGEYDELLPKAVEIVLEYGQASISMLQRRLRVGYARAARLIDEMEIRKIVSPFEGSKARQVLITWDMYEEMFGAADE